MIDPTFAKKQLDLLTREWYMKPDGQIPAYEWNFSDGESNYPKIIIFSQQAMSNSQPACTCMVNSFWSHGGSNDLFDLL
jgi:hypothetical protein